MAEGFPGHLAADNLADDQAGPQSDDRDRFYPVVRQSPWLGGKKENSREYSPLNEGLPYWLNGLVPLAYGLDNARLKTQVHNVTKCVLDQQQADGWLGPESKEQIRDLWGRFPLLLGFSQLIDANEELSHDVIPAMYKFIVLMHDMLVNDEGLDEIWGRVRYPDMLICLQWLYEHHPRGNKKILLETMQLLEKRGLSWKDWYESKFILRNLDDIDPPITGDHPLFPYVHAVNAGQGGCPGDVSFECGNANGNCRSQIRSCNLVNLLNPPSQRSKVLMVRSRFTADKSLLQNTRDGVNLTFAYHGDVAGSIIGDERESDRSPNRG